MKTFYFKPAELPEVFSWLFACLSASIKKGSGRVAGGEGERQRINWAQFQSAPYLELCEQKGLTCADIFSKMNFVIAYAGICEGM